MERLDQGIRIKFSDMNINREEQIDKQTNKTLKITNPALNV